MSAISTYLEYIRSKIYAKDVRTAIVNAISQCYDDVNKPALQTEAMQAAVQAKINAGQMAAYTVADGSFAGSKLANKAVTTAKLDDGAVTWQKLASQAVHTTEIADGAVTSAKLGDGAVTAAKLANKAVTTAKLDDGAVTWQKLASGAVHTEELADGAVTNVKLADSSVSEGKLASGAVTTAKIANGAITAEKLGNAVVTAEKIADGTITKAKLSNDIDFDVETDTTLTQPGVPADAKAVGDEIADLKSDLSETENEIIRTAGVVEELECGLTEEVKAALLDCFAHVAWISDDGQTYYDALSNALDRSRVLSSIRAVFTQGSITIYDTDELYALKQYLTVTAIYDDGTTKEVNNYTLNGKLVAGTSIITVAYNKKTTTFNVTVTHQAKTLESISATFNSSASITTDNVLDDLRPYLTVRATYADSTTSTIANYSLSGNLNVGTNTITVTYNNKTATFTVNVTQAEATLQSISAAFNQGSAVIYENSSLEGLKPYLTVTARYSNGTTQTVTNYTLSGTLTKGTSTITVSYSEKTATFKVVVTERATLQSITATFTQGSTVIYADSSLDDLKPHLVVTANYSDATTATVTNYTLSGVLATGISTITVSYGGKTDTFNVTVSERPTLQSIVATFTQGPAIIYENSSLNDLKQYLVVTATYSDSTTRTVTDYTLSGTLTAGTSTITVSYGGKTDTFNVTVSARATEPIYKLTNTVEFNGTSDYIDTGLQLLTANKTNLTIVFDILDKIPSANASAMILHCMHEAKPYQGMNIYGRLYSSRSYGFELNSNSGSAGKIYEQNLPSESPVRTKAVWIIDFTSKKSHVHFFINDTSNHQDAAISDDMLDVNITENALIGCYQKTDGTKGRYWTGTMYDFKIYDYAWTDAEAQAYLQEDHS